MKRFIIKLNREMLQELTSAHYTQTEIAKLLECDERTVRTRMREYGIEPLPARRRDQSGERNQRWSGDLATYSGFHQRVHKFRGQPKHCEVCGSTDPTKRYEWANLTGEFNNPQDYQRMCVKCHRAHDGYSPMFVRQGKSTRWSLQYDCCKQCGTTDKKHSAHGLCGSCYTGRRLQGKP